MKRANILAFGILTTLIACTTDDGGAGDGDDVLPKRGELTTDPTIVSATASCWCSGFFCQSDAPKNTHVRVRIDASDLMGVANLGTCLGTIGAASDQGEFDEAICAAYVPVASPCTVGSSHIVGITISNSTGGVTLASVKLNVSS